MQKCWVVAWMPGKMQDFPYRVSGDTLSRWFPFMKRHTRFWKQFLLVILLGFFASCAFLPEHPPATGHKVVIVADDTTLPGRLAPVFVIENPHETYNLIGTPHAQITKDLKEVISVEPLKTTFYYETREFQTDTGVYKNLIYRVHFERVPLEIFPFYLGAGENVGLFVIVTLNKLNQPLLYTMVHTCGCYLTFVPTSYLPETAFPIAWKKDRQIVFSENIPGRLNFPPLFNDKLKTMILIRHGSHRVKDVWLSEEHPGQSTVINAELLPLNALEKLPLDGRTTSFYETSGPRSGYVKSSRKIWERLFMSWWTFDWRVGEDKKLGKNKQDSVLFYTSLTPWERKKSDMRDFKSFLRFWGWNL